MPQIEARGVELAFESRGEGRPLLLLHETATGAAAWGPLLEALAGRVRALALDRRGWGASSAPEGYLRTTIEEQSEDAAEVLEAVVAEPALACGAGIGAVIALDLVIRRPELIAGAVLIEPPLIGLVPAATAALSEDAGELERAVAEGGASAVVDLYLSGSLRALGPGSERLPSALTAAARRRRRSLIAELGAMTAWTLPVARLGDATRPSSIVTAAGAPALLGEAASALAGRLSGSELVELPGRGPPHLEAPERIAAVAFTLLGGAG